MQIENIPLIEIDKKLLKMQITDLLESNIPEASKAGIHNLLGTILDALEKEGPA